LLRADRIAANRGTLNIKLINKFKLQGAQVFTILNAPSGTTGTFKTVNGLSINSNEHLTITGVPTRYARTSRP
jgi:hypothetical protein